MPLPGALASLMQAVPSLPRDGGGAPSPTPPAGGAPPGAGGDAMFQDIANKRFSDSAGADPKMIVNQLKQMKSVAASMFPKVAFRVPNVEKHLTAMYRSLDMALKEAETFLNQQNQSAPIENSAATAAPVGSPMGLP